MIVQSSHKDPVYLDERIESFLLGFRVKLAALTEKELSDNILAVREKLVEKAKNLDQESTRYWNEIKNETYLFDRKEQLSSYLTSATLSDCLLFFDKYFAQQSGDRRKCSSQFFGKGTRYPKATSLDKNVVIISDPSAFKRTMTLLPVEKFEVVSC